MERRVGGGRWRRESGGGGMVEMEVEGAAKEGVGPGEGEEAEVGFVDGGGEVGIGGSGCRRRHGVVVGGGGGAATPFAL